MTCPHASTKTLETRRTHKRGLRRRLVCCACGRPSHIGWMGQGFCSDEHYRAAYKASLS